VQCEDKDGDGHGIKNGMTKMGCNASLKGFGACDGDCNDTDPAVHPGAMETCNFIDDNCDGMVDEQARPTCGEGWCRRYGTSCTANNCTPGQPRAEQCNFFDDDCDGVIDNGTDVQLCGEGLACRKGYCVPAEDAGPPDPTTGSTTTGGATSGGTTTGGTTSGGTTSGAGGSGRGGPPHSEPLTCSMPTRGPRGGSALAALVAVLACVARRKLAPGTRGEKRRKSRSHSHEIAPCASECPSCPPHVSREFRGRSS
jgi:hypothetical protein